MAVNPKIDIFEAKRAKKVTDSTTGETQVVADEEGTSLLFSIKTSFGNDTGEGYSDYLDFGFYITVYESDRWSGWTRVGSKDILPNNPILTDLRNGVTDSFIIGDIPSIIGQTGIVEINGSKSYQIAADLTNGSEHSYFNVSVPFSFVNMHLSASSNGGVAFGKYLENAGYFECKYPTRIYDNLTVDGNQENYGSLFVQNSSNDVAIFEGQGIRVRDHPIPNVNTKHTYLSPTGLTTNLGAFDDLGFRTVKEYKNPDGSTASITTTIEATALTGDINARGIITAYRLGNTAFNLNSVGICSPGETIYKTIRFGITFPSPPIVTLTLQGIQDYRECQVWLGSVLNDQFTVYASNTGQADKDISVEWIAIGYGHERLA